MTKIINTDKAPAAIGPYVQAVDLGNLFFASGQIPIIPATGAIAEGVVEQTRQALANVKAILAAANLSVANIIKTTVFIKNMNDFTTINAEYEKFFVENKHPSFPARSCVEVARLPKDVLIEIEIIAAR